MDVVKLHRMVNQIARNCAATGEAEAIKVTVQHISDYWDPRMKEELMGSDWAGLNHIAARAVESLLVRG